MKLSWSGRLQTAAIPVLLVCVLPNGAGAQARPSQWALSIDFQEVGRKDSGFETDGLDDEFFIADSLGAAVSFDRRAPAPWAVLALRPRRSGRVPRFRRARRCQF